MLSYSTMDTPAGPFTMVVSEAGAVRAAGFTADVAELLKLVHPQLREEAQEVDDVGPVAAAVRSYLDTMSFQAPDFYRACGYQAFGTIDGYPGGVTRHWFTKAL